MKAKIAALIVTVVLLLGPVGSAALAAGSVTYLGKATWTALITDSTDPDNINVSFSFTGGISRVGDEFYLFQGYANTPDGPFVMSGSGFLNGSTLVFTLSESQQHTGSTWRDTGVMHVSIDKSSLNGSMYDIGTDFDSGPARTFGQHRYTAATLTHSEGTIPFAPVVAGLNLLLLE